MALEDEETKGTPSEVEQFESSLGKKPENTSNEADGEEGDESSRLAEGAAGDDEDEHGEDEGRPSQEGESLSAEEKRERNRKWREDRKKRQREREEAAQRQIQMLARQNTELAERLSQIERKSTGMEVATVDAHIRSAAEEYQFYKNQIAEGMQTQNPALVTEAIEKMNAAQRKAEQLTRVKQGYQRNQQTPAPVDQRLLSHAQRWMNENPWYSHNGTDADSIRAATEDRILTQEGWQPTTPEYWEELSRRVGQVLPHRAKTVYNAPNAKKSGGRPPVAGASASSSPDSVPKGAFRLSQERVEAIKEAGSWDDPKKRERMIAAFKRYDAEHGNT